MCPFDYGNFDQLVLCITTIMFYLISVCNTGESVIACMITLVICEYVNYPLVYKLENMWTLGRQLAILNILMTVFAVISSISILIAYIVRIRGRIRYLVIENINLLNKMHEGLIVLSEHDMNLKFANLPAVNLVKQKSAGKNDDEKKTSIEGE